jgi:hypothetical protein
VEAVRTGRTGPRGPGHRRLDPVRVGNDRRWPANGAPVACRGMFELDEARSIDRPAAEVWAVLVDFPNVPLWEDGVREVRQTSDGRPALGPRSWHAASSAVARASSTVGSSSGRTGASRRWRSSAVRCVARRPVTSWSRRARAPVGSSTRSTASCSLRLGWLTPLVPFMGRRLVRSNLARLERLVEDRAKCPRYVTVAAHRELSGVTGSVDAGFVAKARRTSWWRAPFASVAVVGSPATATWRPVRSITSKRSAATLADPDLRLGVSRRDDPL